MGKSKELTDPRLDRIVYSLWDFQQALSALTFLLEECDFSQCYNKLELRRFRCYETTLIISMARPFEASRNGNALNLGLVDIKLDVSERKLKDKVMLLRRKIIAHSDEEEMHYRSVVFSVTGSSIAVPHIHFDEGLHLAHEELLSLESLLRKLKHGIAIFLFDLANQQPERLAKYRVPERLGDSGA